MENKKAKIKMPKWQSGVVLFSRISGLIIIPVFGVFFILKWLDKKYEINQEVFIGIIFLVLIFSFLGIIREVKKELNKK